MLGQIPVISAQSPVSSSSFTESRVCKQNWPQKGDGEVSARELCPVWEQQPGHLCQRECSLAWAWVAQVGEGLSL